MAGSWLGVPFCACVSGMACWKSMSGQPGPCPTPKLTASEGSVPFVDPWRTAIYAPGAGHGMLPQWVCWVNVVPMVCWHSASLSMVSGTCVLPVVPLAPPVLLGVALFAAILDKIT